MKRCPRCGELKSLEAFSPKQGRRCQAYCKACAREYQRGRPRLLLAKRLVRAAKKRPCADCGVEYPYYVMDFDHCPGTFKRANLSVLVKRGASNDVLLKELAKCDVVCANCHRVRTHQRKQAIARGLSKAAVAQW